MNSATSTDNNQQLPRLTLDDTAVTLTEQLVDIASPSHNEAAIADVVEHALRNHFNGRDCSVEIHRFNNNVIARTNYGLPSRVILAGHLDTVPIADNVPSHRETATVEGQAEEQIWGCGSVDMKSGDAVFLHAFATLADGGLQRDVTLICYEGEEVASRFNGLGHIAEQHPEWLEGDVAILGEPSAARIEGGCQGSIRLRITAHGTRAHSARAWMGLNAMHVLSPVISRVAAYQPATVDIDGLKYREGLNIVHCESGVATNTIPDEAWMFVNFRFAPNRTVDEALALMLEVLDLPEGVSYDIDDAVSGALPGLSVPAAQELIDATGEAPAPKFGWTDVARFSELGIPAVNFGPGDPALCHKRDEHCPVWMIERASQVILDYLGGVGR